MQPNATPTPTPPSPPSGPMTRARVKALHDKVNSILATLDLDTPLDGMLPHAETLCVIRYKDHQGYEGEEAPFIKEEENQINGKEEKEKKKDMRRKDEGRGEKRRGEMESGASMPRGAGASTHGWQEAGATLAAHMEGGPVVPAPPGRYYRRVLGGTSWCAGLKGRPIPPAGGSGRGTARGTRPPVMLPHAPRYLGWRLRPRYRSGPPTHSNVASKWLLSPVP